MIASQYFPIKDVSSLRIHSYCKSLVKHGVDIKVLVIYPSQENISLIGNFEGVNYQFLSNKKSYQKNVFSKFYSRFLGLLFIGKYIRRKKIDAVLSYHDNFLTNIFLKCFTSLASIPYILDKTEYPYGYFRKSNFQKRIIKFNLKLFDGFIVISKELKSFYTNFSENVFLLPMTIDSDRFQEVLNKEKSKPKYIALTFGTHNRDGLYESVVAYHKYYKMNTLNPFLLYLVGDYAKLCEKFPECYQIINYIKSNRLTNNIFILGKQPIEKVPSILIGASCLLTTPIRYASGGFPTKLGEYMLSGVPVVATNAGEISDYVINKFDILLSNVGDLTDVARNILFIQEHPLEAFKIGRNGMNTAKTKFNADTYINDLIKFIYSLK
ncbi:Glycosyl transferases group 1 [anaerobic digester metagenome]